ncbi:MAG: tRNA uridine-5-carboxymethylaminomethyl(34) synthesis GTPase MnmE [Firmicutes bacterium]|nr:tRNA uridine-5-carboxymethylaminomethyl(34) synthesis GTPase MnmE [Bacillota bacterium]
MRAATVQDTIAAIATPPGEGAIGIVRMSGPGAVAIAERVVQSTRRLSQVPSHSLVHGKVVDEGGRVLDEALVAVMRAPRTYTGEDVVEIHCHGSPVVLQQVLARLLQEGARPAEPGEFTKRAFLNGKLDLAQAEAVIDLVRAKSPKGAQIAAMQLEGRLSARVSAQREEILDLLAHLQAVIDYPEEGLVDVDPGEMKRRLERLVDEIDQLLAGADAGRIYRDGIRLAIVGRPNVGKSSLLNALLGEERAIVTPIAGTTRDVIEERALLGGIPFTLADTAGVRATDDPVEAIGVERTRQAVAGADLVLIVLDGSEALAPEDLEVAELVRQAGAGARVLVAVNKCDLPRVLEQAAVERLAGPWPVVWVSAVTGEGLARLEETAAAQVLGQGGAPSAILVTRARHRGALAAARRALEDAGETIARGLPLDLVSVDLQEALEALGQVTGESVSEEVVARIFAQFCVGK